MRLYFRITYTLLTVFYLFKLGFNGFGNPLNIIKMGFNGFGNPLNIIKMYKN